jgi:hypothetical protein
VEAAEEPKDVSDTEMLPWNAYIMQPIRWRGRIRTNRTLENAGDYALGNIHFPFSESNKTFLLMAAWLDLQVSYTSSNELY